MARDAGVHSRHDAAPLVTSLVEIGVADTAEEDYIGFSRIAPRNRGGGKRRRRASSGVSVRLVHRDLVHSLISMLLGCSARQDSRNSLSGILVSGVRLDATC